MSDIAPSKPEPPPVKKGIEVTPLLLSWLHENQASPDIINLILSRHAYGLNKYGQSLMTGDKRDTMEDARQEAGDLLQYLYKGHLQGLKSNPVLKETLELCLALIDDMK